MIVHDKTRLNGPLREHFELVPTCLTVLLSPQHRREARRGRCTGPTRSSHIVGVNTFRHRAPLFPDVIAPQMRATPRERECEKTAGALLEFAAISACFGLAKTAENSSQSLLREVGWIGKVSDEDCRSSFPA